MWLSSGLQGLSADEVASGLINNVLYVIILSAALDLVGPRVPKGVVLLADVLPSFLVKLTAPYYIHIIPYPIRVIIFVLLSAGGMLIIALSPSTHDASSVVLKLFGVALASLSSGGGELSFLGLTHYYGHASLAAWSSGTGGAGLVGAGAYVLATATFGLSSRASLFLFSFLPLIMLVSFFAILPLRSEENLTAGDPSDVRYEALPDDDESADALPETVASNGHEDSSPQQVGSPGDMTKQHIRIMRAWQGFRHNLQRARGLFFP